MKVFILLIMGIGLLHSVSAATHSLHYVYTATSGIPDFPEFVTVGLVNREPISYYDSIIRTETPRQDWMANNEGSDYWESQTQISNGTEQTFKANIDILKQRFNQTGVPPSVFLLQRTPSSPVTCHATGFYPSRVMVTWKKDGQEQYEDVEVGETLQNDDGTFQKSVHLAVKPEEWKNNKYQCVVQVSGIKEDFIKDLTEDQIQTNTGFVPANTSDDGSNSSNNTAPKA